MLDQFDRITQAVGILNGMTGAPQERLVKGFKAFYRATIASEDWPAQLWDKYNRICEIVLAGGTLQKTADRMDQQTASECAKRVAAEMTDLAAAVEAARTQRFLPPPVIGRLPRQGDSPSGRAELTGAC